MPRSLRWWQAATSCSTRLLSAQHGVPIHEATCEMADCTSSSSSAGILKMWCATAQCAAKRGIQMHILHGSCKGLRVTAAAAAASMAVMLARCVAPADVRT